MEIFERVKVVRIYLFLMMMVLRVVLWHLVTANCAASERDLVPAYVCVEDRDRATDEVPHVLQEKLLAIFGTLTDITTARH